MKINIYYGGRGVIGDPTLPVIKRMMQVFEELNVKVERYDLYDQKNNITTLPQTLKEADGIILATTVEWHGVGGNIMSFLDACWLYGDKERIQKIYMAPVVMATTYGEKEAELDLKNAWESLGGPVCDGICGFIPDAVMLEQNDDYIKLVEKSAENIYRSINQKKISLPTSGREVRQKVSKTKTSLFTQQETEQLSEYISDEDYVTKQKKDIKELSGFFKDLLEKNSKDSSEDVITKLKNSFKPVAGQHVKYKIEIKDKKESIAIKIDNDIIDINQSDIDSPDVVIGLSEAVLGEIIAGRKTFQGGFMEGKITSKGNFALMQMLDTFFPLIK